jgi:hypothetical protein
MRTNNKSIECVLFSTANVMLSHIDQFDRDAFLRSRNYYECQLNQAKSEGIDLDTRKYRRTEKLYKKARERARVLGWLE